MMLLFLLFLSEIENPTVLDLNVNCLSTGLVLVALILVLREVAIEAIINMLRKQIWALVFLMVLEFFCCGLDRILSCARVTSYFHTARRISVLKFYKIYTDTFFLYFSVQTLSSPVLYF